MGQLLYLFTVNQILIEAGRILSLQPWLSTVKAQTSILKVESAFKFKEQIPPENAVNSSIWDLVAARTSSLGTTCPLILQLMPPVQCTACYSTMTSLPRHFQLQQRDYGKPWGHDKKSTKQQKRNTIRNKNYTGQWFLKLSNFHPFIHYSALFPSIFSMLQTTLKGD